VSKSICFQYFGTNAAPLRVPEMALRVPSLVPSVFFLNLKNTTALRVIPALPMPCNSQEGNCMKPV
jgi:hypothetical protein